VKTDEGLLAVRRATWIGFQVNAVLMVLKIVIGLVGHSQALVADGVHSLSDFATDIIVLIFVGIAYQRADATHPYGHGKFETLASLLIAVALMVVAVGIGVEAYHRIVYALSGHELARPAAATIAVAALSIVSKEWLYRYTRRVARAVNSPALLANAWHHRSDAFSSVATLIGVSAAFALGAQWRLLDPVVSLVIAAFILTSAVHIAMPSVNELLERSLPDGEVARIAAAISSVEGVENFHRLCTRRNGHAYIVDVRVRVNPDITVTAGHDIATAVERAVAALFDHPTVTNVHIEPLH
jgi:cation diffusion facilitator family transporter